MSSASREFLSSSAIAGNHDNSPVAFHESISVCSSNCRDFGELSPDAQRSAEADLAPSHRSDWGYAITITLIRTIFKEPSALSQPTLMMNDGRLVTAMRERDEKPFVDMGGGGPLCELMREALS